MIPFLILNNFDWLIPYDMELYYFWKAHFKLKFPLMMALSTVEEKCVTTCLATWERGAVKLQFVIQIEISRKREFYHSRGILHGTEYN